MSLPHLKSLNLNSDIYIYDKSTILSNSNSNVSMKSTELPNDISLSSVKHMRKARAQKKITCCVKKYCKSTVNCVCLETSYL
jgi:hypothetical protein